MKTRSENGKRVLSRNEMTRLYLVIMRRTQIYSRVHYYTTLIRSRWRQWQPTPVLLPGGSHGRRSLVGYNPWGCKESDTTERLHFHFSLLRIGEGNGNPLQCSCLKNPRDGGAWWLLSMGSHRVGHDWSDLAAAAVVIFHLMLTNPCGYN